MTPHEGEDLNALILTAISDPVGIALVENLFDEAEIPYFRMDASVVPRQESGNFIGWWNVRVPKEREAEAREIVRSVEDSRQDLPPTE